MSLIRPFRGLRATAESAIQIAAPPYDVVSAAEALLRAANTPLNFLHISRAEIDLAPGLDPYDASVYQQARRNLVNLIACGALRRDPVESYYAYRLKLGTHIQTGLVCAASVDAYRENRIKRHELTRPEKEEDRVRHIETIGVQTGPAMLAYPESPRADDLLAEATAGTPAIAVDLDGVQHSIWSISEPDLIVRLTRAFDALPALYIADGHHRCAAAERVAKSRRSLRTAGVWEGFLAVAFPHHAMRVLEYNRVVADLKGMSENDFLSAISARFDVQSSSHPVQPAMRREFGLYLRGRWFQLRAHGDRIPQDDLVGRLDASILSDQLLGPVLGINDLRRDSRIDFVGGARGLHELELRVDSGMACAFVLFPTAIDDLMAVADSGAVMPPKSTWFEPKLADGLISYVLEPI